MGRTTGEREGRSGRQPLPAERLQAVLAEAAAHRVAGRYAKAVALYEAVERSNPDGLDAPYFLALIDLALGRPTPALARLAPLSRRAFKLPDVWEALVHTRRELGQWREAVAASRKLVSLRPGHTLAWFDLADALEVLGQIDEAVDILRRLASAPEARIEALIRAASLRPDAVGQAERDEIAAAARDQTPNAERQVGAGFMLATLLEREGLYDEAFVALARANQIKRRVLTGQAPAPPPPAIGPDVRALRPPEAEREDIAAIGFLKAVFTLDFLASHAGGGHHLNTPIFIVGLPRSGSTLIEQILSSHPKVQGLGESNALLETLEGHFPYALFQAEQPDHFRRLADAYLAATHARGWTSSPRFVDKLLRNYMHIGAIHRMFPRAVILHARRDPVDACLANFRQNFATGNELSYHLGDIGRQYVRYREVMDYWRQVLPGRVIDVDHEALVTDPGARIRWLVTEACGLTWDEACLRFNETRRAVRTASVAQVRQPIFTSSLQRWRRYEKHLGPLFEALGPYAPASR